MRTRYAIKSFKGNLSSGVSSTVVNEVQKLLELKSTYFTRFYDYFCGASSHFIVMEYCEVYILY